MSLEIKELKKAERKIRNYVLFIIMIIITSIVISILIGLFYRKINIMKYNLAQKSLSEKDYESAKEQFEKLGYFKDSYERKYEAIRGLMFNQAQELKKSEKYESAIAKFEEIIDLSDTDDELKLNCENAAIELRYIMADEIYNAGDDKKAIENYEKLVELYSYSHNEFISKSKDRIKEIKYSLAEEYFDNKQYSEADTLFKELGDYLDSSAYVARIATLNDENYKETVYKKAISLMEEGEYEEAIRWFTDIESYPGSKDKIDECKKLLKMTNLNHNITTGVNNSYAIDLNNKVKSVGETKQGQRKVNNDKWKNIISLDCYGTLTIGLNSDHKVVIAGSYDNNKTVNMDHLENIIDVTAGEQFVAALDKDGKVYADGLFASNWDLTEWDDVIDIDAGWDFLVGLTKNHELRFIGIDDDTEFFKKKYVKADWENVISISAGGGGDNVKRRDEGHGHIVGLKKDGKIIAIGDDNYGQCSEAKNNWDKVVRISAGDWYTVGLTETGGVLITGENFSGSYYIDNPLGKEGLKNLKNVVEISAGFGQTLCLKSDGKMYPFGFDDESSPNELYKTKDWSDLLLPIY